MSTAVRKDRKRMKRIWRQRLQVREMYVEAARGKSGPGTGFYTQRHVDEAREMVEHYSFRNRAERQKSGRRPLVKRWKAPVQW